MKKKFKILLSIITGLFASFLFLVGIGFISFSNEIETEVYLFNETDNTTKKLDVNTTILEDGTRVYFLGNVLISANEITSITKSI